MEEGVRKDERRRDKINRRGRRKEGGRGRR